MVDIVYVEDDLVNALVFQRMLKTKCRVIHFADGESCLKALDDINPVAFFLDINLGHSKMNGMELMLKIKAMSKFENKEFFAVTAFAFPEDKIRFLTAGFTGYISKPMLMDELIQTVTSISGAPSAD